VLKYAALSTRIPGKFEQFLRRLADGLRLLELETHPSAILAIGIAQMEGGPTAATLGC
jgi:hypothetical protein